MLTVASKVRFSELTGLVEKISNRKGTDAKKQLMKSFVDQWRQFHNTIHKDDPNTTDSFFPAMRLILPQLEKDRDAYGIKEHTLAKLYIEILGLGKDSPSAQKLLHYKAPRNAKAEAGDFATVAYFVLKDRCPEKGTLTIEEVNHCLDEVATSNAAKNKEGVRKNLLHMLKNMSAQEQKWLIRMIMKELKMGISQQSIFSLFHQDAEDLFNVKMSLEKVCTMLRDPAVRMHEIEVSLFSPFRPMLGDRTAPNKVEKIMENKSFFIETKFDGERMQLHKKGDQYKFFSRGGNDYTHTFGAHSFDGNLVGHIHNCFNENLTSCILDGEMVGYNPETKVIRSKGENFDIKAQDAEGYQPCFCAFDILFYNDQVLSNKALRERKETLKNAFEPIEGRIILSSHKECRTRQECVEALNEAIDNREEGIMVKDPQSVYKPNTRKGGWYKIKPEYVGGLMDELDVVVVGGYFGVGHRAGLMSHFLCAVAVPPPPGQTPTLFHSFCRVGSGYSKKELYDFNRKLADHWQPFDKKRPPSCIVLAPGLKQKPDLWIEPSKSAILQIKAAEIVDSDQYKTACTLRFPRVEKIRDDKPWYDCMTVTEIEELRKKSEGKLAGRYADDDGEDEPSKKKRRVVTTRHVKPTVMSKFKATDVSGVSKISEMLLGKEICVVNGPASHPKSVLEKKIAEYGGTVVQHPGSETCCVLADKVAVKVRNIISKGIYDVVKVDWLLRCTDAGHFIPWVPADMIHTSKKTEMLFAQGYDRHGDSYFEDTTVEKLKQVFKKIEEEKSGLPLHAEDIAEMEIKYFPNECPLGLFRLCRVYLDMNLVIGEPSTHIKACSLELTGLELRFYGATIADKLDEKVSHIVVHSKDLSRVRAFREENKKRNKKAYIVTEVWVELCIEAGYLKNEREFDPPPAAK